MQSMSQYFNLIFSNMVIFLSAYKLRVFHGIMLSLGEIYVRALYGLGVLYVFELDEPAKAIPYLEKLLTIDTKHIDAMFVLARAYYSTFEFDKAVQMYDKIIATSNSEETKSNAEANKKIALEAAYAK